MKERNNHEFSDEELSGPVIDRRTTMKLLGAAGIASTAGCLGLSSDETEPEDVDTGGRLTAGWFLDSVDNLDPTNITTGQYFQLAANIFNGLVMLDTDFTIQGDLATDWTIEDDGRTMTFELHEDVVFHNGDDCTAEDVRYSIERTIRDETINASRLDSLAPIDEGGVEVVDDYTVRLNFEEPYAPALVTLTRGPGRAAAVVSQRAVEEMGDENFQAEPVGTGPFQVREHNVGSRVVLDANENYFKTDDEGNQLPYLDGIDVDMIPEPSTMVSGLRTGDVHFANELPPQNVSELDGDGTVDLLRGPGANWRGLIMNMTREPFDTPKARRGIAKLIDKEAFVDTAHFGEAEPAYGPITPAIDWAHRDEKPDHQVYDREEGLRLLEEEGYLDTSFTILSDANYSRDANVIYQHLSDAGLDVELEQLPTANYWERMADMDYDAMIDGNAIGPDPDFATYNWFRHPDNGGVWNYMGYDDDTSDYASEVDDLLAEQRRTVDQTERAEILQEIEDYVIEDVGQAFLVHRDDILAKRSEVQGFVHIPYMRYFDTVWLD